MSTWYIQRDVSCLQMARWGGPVHLMFLKWLALPDLPVSLLTAPAKFFASDIDGTAFFGLTLSYALAEYNTVICTGRV